MLGRLWAAIGFLTILPLPAFCRQTEDDLPRSVPLFPLIGLFIGGVVGGSAYLTSGLLPPVVAVVVYVILLAIVHGGLHVDGLADTGDGFFSHRKTERILEIMRDTHIGTYGSLTLVSVLALKVAGLASMPASMWVKALFLAPVAGRCSMVLMLAMLPSARTDGMGILFKRGRSFWEVLWALSVLLLAAWFLLQWRGLVAVGAVLVCNVSFMGLCQSKINGFTGDTLGALSELSEALTLVTLSVLFFRI
ncbi:MAG: adenosylcobinamide-GDP ribazoletransferase [bacterium]